MINIKFFLLISFCLFVTNIYAQYAFTSSDKKEFQERVKMKVEEFQGYLSDIVNTKLSDKERQSSIKSALALFRGKGEFYYIENKKGQIEKRNPVRVILYDKCSSRKRWLRMTKFLNNLYNNIYRYGTVSIISVDADVVDCIYKDSAYYKAVIHQQRYVFGREGTSSHQKTSKKSIVNIVPIETPLGIVWDTKLGDIYISTTKFD